MEVPIVVTLSDVIIGVSPGKQFLRALWKHRHYYILLLPAFIYVAIFNYGPMYGIQIAFKDYKSVLGVMGSQWVGFKHFINFFNSYYFLTLFRNTLALSLYSLAVGFPLPILLALMVNELNDNKFRKAIQTIMYAPHFISVVVLVGIMHTVFSPSMGIFNTAREALGLERMYYVAMPSAFRHLYVWSGVWQGLGWSSIIYVAALSSVDPELHEAAVIDGASRFQRMRYINIPTIAPTITILLIMSVGRLVSVGYEKVLLLQNNLNVDVSEVISTYVYKRGIINTNYSFSSAVGLFNNLINIALLLVANGLSRWVSDTSLF